MKGHFHCSYNINYHLVLVTKYKKKCLSEDINKNLKITFEKLLTKWESNLLEFRGESDHIHLIFNSNPTVQPSKLVNTLKTVSSRYIRRDFKLFLEKFYTEPIFWSRAYCLVSVGGEENEIVEKYIQRQGNH